MALDGMITGASTSTHFTNPNGIVKISGLSSASLKQDVTKIKEYEINGTVHLAGLYQGWSGTAMFIRLDSSMDEFIQLQEVAYYSALNQTLSNMTQIITEQNGSQTQIDYIECLITMPNAGTFSNQDIVKYSIDIECKRRLVRTS